MNSDPKQSKEPKIDCVVHISREYGSLAGAGGIKDVTEGLCKAAAAMGIDTHIFLPYYRVIDKKNLHLKKSQEFDVEMNYSAEKRTESVTIYSSLIKPKLTVHLIKAQRYQYLAEGKSLIKRQGIYQYTKEEAKALGRPELEGKGYIDFFAMNVLLVKATLHGLGKMQIRPDIVHCHDGHTALLPLIAQASEETFVPYLRYVPSVITIHNAGRGYHQEVSDLEFAAAICGVSRDVIKGSLLNGFFDPLLAGGLFGSAINTVSENYARELQKSGQDSISGWLGHKLAGYGIKLLGVTNGIDPETSNSENSEQLGLAAGFSILKGNLAGKEVCKKSTLQELERREVPENIVLKGAINYQKDIPLLTFIGRLGQQKGFDILADAVELLFNEDEHVQILGLGDGDPSIIDRFCKLEKKFKKRVCMAKGYSHLLANKIYAAGDFFVIPSRFEPCGLTDFFAQLMGNVPIVHRVGGLVKTLDGRFGFSYLGGAEELLQTLRRALKVYREPDKKTLSEIQINAVKNIYENFTWEKVLEKKYLPIYRDVITRSDPSLPY
jgi:starch synthase